MGRDADTQQEVCEYRGDVVQVMGSWFYGCENAVESLDDICSHRKESFGQVFCIRYRVGEAVGA